MTSKTIDLVVDRLSAVRCGALGRRMAKGRQAAEAFRQVFADLGIFFGTKRSAENRSSAALRILPTDARLAAIGEDRSFRAMATNTGAPEAAGLPASAQIWLSTDARPGSRRPAVV